MEKNNGCESIPHPMININGEQGLGLTWCTTSLCLKANCGRWEHVCTILNILNSFHLFLIILIIKEQVTYIRLPVYFVIIFLIGLTDNYTSHHLLDSPLKCCKLNVNPSSYKFNTVNKKDKKKHRGRTKEFWYTPSLVSTKDKT